MLLINFEECVELLTLLNIFKNKDVALYILCNLAYTLDSSTRHVFRANNGTGLQNN